MSYKLQVTKSQSGMAAILTVVIVGAAVLIMAKSVSLSAVDDVMVSAALNAGESAMTTAEGCAEETIRRLRLDPDYAADGFVLPLSGGECVIDTAAYGETRVIDILASMDNYYKRLRVTVTISGSNATVTGWEETN